MERRYRVYAHGCYIHGLASIDQKILDSTGLPLIAAGNLYRKRLDLYPHITRIVIAHERRFPNQPNIGPLTIKNEGMGMTKAASSSAWEICERYRSGRWSVMGGCYDDLETVRGIVRDITRLRNNRVNAMGLKMPFWAVLKSGDQHAPF